MFSPEEQQIEICLLKSNLEKIGDDLLVHVSDHVFNCFSHRNDRVYFDKLRFLRISSLPVSLSVFYLSKFTVFN